MHGIRENRVCRGYMKWSGCTPKLCEKQCDCYTQRIRKQNDYVLNVIKYLYTQEGCGSISEELGVIKEQQACEEPYPIGLCHESDRLTDVLEK